MNPESLKQARQQAQTCPSGSHLAVDDKFMLKLLDHVDALEKKLEKAREALEEMSLPPYKDSDEASLLRWVNARAASVLKELES